jgi:alpha-L-arabinofuranosidase
MTKYILFFIVLVYASDGTLDAQVQISVNAAQQKHTINPMVQGMGIIYSFEADSLYEDGRLAQIYKDAGLGFLRWPGGAVTTFYHWNDLNGQGWMDNWKPAYDHSKDKEPADYMDLDEYMALCRAAETEPMLGINMSSGMEWDREADALNEAVDMVKYCIGQNFDVNYIYLDNETYHNGNSYNADPDNDGESWTAALYGEKINLYADSIRKYLPEVKLIPNWKRNIKNGNASLKTLINVAGENIDYIDVHWYWKWGEASWEEWIAKSPMEMENEWYDGGTIMEEIASFASLTTNLGHSHIKLASLEWNIGPGPWQEDLNHSKFRTALMQSEMQMQMMLGGLEVGSLWAAHWPGTEDANDRFLLDPDEGHTPNPTSKVYELYKNALNGVLLESNSSDNKILVAAAVKEDNNSFVYLLNKNTTSTLVNINLDAFEKQYVKQALCFKDPGIVDNISVVDNNSSLSAVIPAYSLTMIELSGEASNVSEKEYDEPNELNIWPNPASEFVTIQSTMSGEEARFLLYDVVGKPVISMEKGSWENGSITLGINDLSAGSYFAIVWDESGNKTMGKLMISR